MSSHWFKYSVWALGLIMGIFACSDPKAMKIHRDKHPEEILGNPNYQAISYGGYRGLTIECVYLGRDNHPKKWGGCLGLQGFGHVVLGKFF